MRALSPSLTTCAKKGAFMGVRRGLHQGQRKGSFGDSLTTSKATSLAEMCNGQKGGALV